MATSSHIDRLCTRPHKPPRSTEVRNEDTMLYLSGEPEICVPIRDRLKFEMPIHLTEEGLKGPKTRSMCGDV
jgi:hypothetical protein